MNLILRLSNSVYRKMKTDQECAFSLDFERDCDTHACQLRAEVSEDIRDSHHVHVPTLPCSGKNVITWHHKRHVSAWRQLFQPLRSRKGFSGQFRLLLCGLSAHATVLSRRAHSSRGLRVLAQQDLAQGEIVVPERDKGPARPAHPGNRVVRAVQESILQKERRPVRDQRVALHLAKSDSPGAFAPLVDGVSVYACGKLRTKRCPPSLAVE